MSREREFRAPWGRTLWITTVLVVAITVAVGGIVASQSLGHGNRLVGFAALLPAVILIVPALFTVRGYVVTPNAIVVLRPIGRMELPPLSTLQWARVEPNAMRWSLRTFGNGGLYAFSGCFRNRKLGHYRAWVTDLRRTVVLGFSQRTIVLSPDDPDEFVRFLSEARGDVQTGPAT